MISLLCITLLHLPAVLGGALRAHLSDSHRLKCDTLPYRTIYSDDGCYFAVLRKIKSTKASDECSTVLFGAKQARKPREALFESLMVDKSDFHLDNDSDGLKYIICSYENDEKCDVDQATLLSGRCLVRGTKKLNFVDAESYCKERGMEIPAPANDLDNRIVRDVLVKDPVWLNVNLESGLKLNQVRNFSRWSTCEMPAKGQNKLYTGSKKACTKDLKIVVDKDGYWSTTEMQNQMDIICTKNSVNDFASTTAVVSAPTVQPTVPGPTCDYHRAVVNEKPLPAASIGFGMGKTCYAESQASSRYEVLGRTTVETRRGCEVACDGQTKCIAFSFKDAGLKSSCVLLSAVMENETCDPPTTVFIKKRTGCVDRTNLTAEFGNDPCVDEIVPSAFRGLGQYRICKPGKDNLYIIRAIDEHGRRITIHNDYWNWIRKSGDMWEWVYLWGLTGDRATKKIVAATCALAAGDKCPCEPLKNLKDPKFPTYQTYVGTPERIGPCNHTSAELLINVVETPTRMIWWDNAGTKRTFVTCKAGMWIIWAELSNNSWGVTGVSCWNRYNN